MSQLPDAELRLKECQRNFERIHGKNLERVQALKGSCANEQALYTRLHLLQGICAFHQGKRAQAKVLLEEVRKDIAKLEIDPDALAETIALGYTDREARIALRANDNNVAGAVRFAQKLREDRVRTEEANAKRVRYGKTRNGNWVNVGKVKTLLNFGYLEDLIVVALRETDNDLNDAIDMMVNQADVLNAAVQSAFLDKEEEEEEKKSEEKNEPSTSKAAAKKEEEKLAKRARKEASKRFREELGDSLGDTENYLDLPLEEEAAYLEKYLKYLEFDGTGLA